MRRQYRTTRGFLEAMTCSQRICGGCLIFVVASITGLVAGVNAATYTVGDDVGTWTIPATTNDLNYTTWVEARNFRFGDELIFQYATSQHSVLLVNASGYDTCSLEDPIASFSSGADSVGLNRTGVRDYYFVCGGVSHCWLQQKLHITLLGPVPEALGVPTLDSTRPKSSAASPRAASGPVKLAVMTPLLILIFSSNLM